MIPSTKTRTVESTLRGEDVAMTLDPRAAAHLMSVLTDLYADRETAILREYSTNARDSHIEAGNTDPIEVELPTPLRPTLVIRDRGIGLDADGIEIYSRYGASTKRDTNEATGMLGLGCKSALTITDQFSLVGVKDGERTVVSVSRNADGGGTMKILEAGETDDPNGVEVMIPVPQFNRLEQKARELFRFWPEGSVLVNGEAPERLTGGTQVTPEITAWPRHTRYDSGITVPISESYVVQGGVPYPAEFEGVGDVRIVAEVPIGSVDFAPSREALMDTRHTRETLALVAEAFNGAKRAAMEAAINAAKTPTEALQAWSQYRFLAKGLSQPKWRKREIPVSFKFGYRGCTIVGKRHGYRGGLSVHHKADEVSLEQAATAYWFTGFTNATFAAPMRRKLEAFLADRLGLTDEKAAERAANGAVLLAPQELRDDVAEWIDESRVFDWADVRAFKVDPAATGGMDTSHLRVTGTYETVKPQGGRSRKFPASELPKRGLYYVEGTAWTHGTTAEQLQRVLPNAYLCVVPSPRLAKFRRDLPHAVEVHEGLRAEARKWWKARTAQEKRLLKHDPTGDEDSLVDVLAAAGIPFAKLDDAELRKAVQTAADRQDLGKLRQEYAERLPRLTAAEGRTQAQDSPLTKYPLASTILAERSDPELTEHLTIYLNAAHAAGTE